MAPSPADAAAFPPPLSAYPPPSAEGLVATLLDRVHQVPFNAVATGIFALAIIHTFLAARFAALAHHVQHEHDRQRLAAGSRPAPSPLAEFLHFFGEVEVIFGLWVVVLMVAMTSYYGWNTAKAYLADGVNYTEAVFVVVVMAMAATRPVIVLAESALRRVAQLGGETPAAWWLTILTIGPILGSLITEPAAMTICALLLARKFYAREPSLRFKFATLGLLFVNISVGGTLTHFAAPPVLMVARLWNWDTAFMSTNLGWRAVIAVLLSNLVYLAIFRRELRALADRPSPEVEPAADEGEAADAGPVPAWVTVTHLLFMAFAVVNSHYPPLVIGAFMFFLGFMKATSAIQAELDLKAPLLVGFFLAGLVIHGSLQAWWIEPTLAILADIPLFFGAIVLSAFNDNALITYLATLVPGLAASSKIAVVAGAVTGGGLTVIANAPNPAGQAILGRYFGGTVAPLGLLLGALLPTLFAILAFRIL
jgi:hypothetical protein